MKEEFLKRLDYGLRPLKRSERKKNLNNYEEIIQDKLDSGMPEETVISQLGTAFQAAEEMLDSYADAGGGKYFNKIYVVYDAIVILISWLLAYGIRRLSLGTLNGALIQSLVFSDYLFILLVIVLPCSLLVYALSGLYTLACVRKKTKEAGGLLLANAVAWLIIMAILYIIKAQHISRAVIAMYMCICTFLEILVREAFYGIGFGAFWLAFKKERNL